MKIKGITYGFLPPASISGVLFCVVSAVAAAAFFSCTKADVSYRGDGLVLISPERTEYSLPALQYHFYPTDGQTASISLPCNGSGNFEGSLPVGVYRVIAVNTGCANTGFVHLDRYDLAAAQMNQPQPQQPEQPPFQPPGDLYSVVVSELAVVASDTVRCTPKPVLLTRRLTLVFTLQSGLENEVVSLCGVFHGVYPAVRLYDSRCTDAVSSRGVGVSIPFEASGQGNRRTAHIRLFGLYDPAYGDAYTHILPLELTLTDGSVMRVEADLTGVLSDAISQHQGTIPLELAVPVGIARVASGFEGIIDGWIKGEENEEEQILMF